MELRRAADVLLRSQTTPICSLLNPAYTSRWTAGSQFCYQAANKKAAQKTLTTSSRNQAMRPQATTSATPTANEGAEAPAKPSDDINEMSKNLWTNRTSRLPAKLSPESEKLMNGGSSAEDILSAIDLLTKKDKGSSSSSANFDFMLDPKTAGDNKNFLDAMTSGKLSMPERPRPKMRLTPSTGRSVSIGTGVDFARGLRLVEQSCARNRIRADATYQRFYERGGLKRKRLRRQRWRKRFMEGFKATVKRVKQLKHQGW